MIPKDSQKTPGSARPPSLGETRAPAKVTVPELRRRKGSGRKILALTAYDYPSARLVDEAGFDVILVGDSMANVVLGHASTLKITLDQIISATRAVRRAADRPLVVSDMPFGTYHTGCKDTVRNALRLVREGGAMAVKLEGGARRAHLIAALVEADIPVMGHIGLLPQAAYVQGGYHVQGRSLAGARKLVEDALAVEAAGAFAMVIEGVPAEVAAHITERVRIPTIGIGAGGGCDGQILVFHDVIGLIFGTQPRFARRYAEVAETIRGALRSLVADMRSGAFPTPGEAYHLKEPLPEDWDTAGKPS